jgi:hypothetical protein
MRGFAASQQNSTIHESVIELQNNTTCVLLRKKCLILHHMGVPLMTRIITDRHRNIDVYLFLMIVSIPFGKIL